ncbi:MAG: YdcF family protein [Snowella sp.]|nr:YdcF family protein [Snowella sp.]
MFLKLRFHKAETPIIPVRKTRMGWLGWLLPLFILGGVVGCRQIQSMVVQPQAIFVLGGHEDREKAAAKLAAQYPDLPIWVSSGSPEGYAKRIFAKAGIQRDRLHLDYQARDTVTNFTTLVDDLNRQGIRSIYLITSDTHMNRARLVGEIVFGSQGIVIKPFTVPSHSAVEPPEKSLRDVARALLWLATGRTGETLLKYHKH